MGTGIDASRRIVIEHVSPEIDCGRYPVKRVVGDILEVSADIFKDGHDKIAAVVKYRRGGREGLAGSARCASSTTTAGPASPPPPTTPLPLHHRGLDRLVGTWATRSRRSSTPGRTSRCELLEGRAILAEALPRAEGDDRERLESAIAADRRRRRPRRRPCAASSPPSARADGALPAPLATCTRYDRELEVAVDRPAARFAAWYEMFPRSGRTDPTRGATFDDADPQAPRTSPTWASTSLYLTPIHPIGRAFRKGKNNTLDAGAGRPRRRPTPSAARRAGTTPSTRSSAPSTISAPSSPRPSALGMEVALDFAFQASPDHPWARSTRSGSPSAPTARSTTPRTRPRSTRTSTRSISTATAGEELWEELRRVILFWVEQGVKTFRVDNPHTKPVASGSG